MLQGHAPWIIFIILGYSVKNKLQYDINNY